MLLHQQGDLALQLALTAGERLLERQEHDGSWRLDAIGQGLLGFSHGASGFAAALARLHASTGDDRFLKAAESALAYERRHFDGQKRNWPDFRTGGNVGDSVASWCHGAPGIALGRACLWGTSVWDDLCLEEIELALLTTADYKNQSTDHLCCGSLGLMAILEMVGEGPWPLSASIREICKAAAQSHRDRALERCGGDPSKSVMVDLRCLSSGGGSWVEPGFFVGLSGMGLALLRDAQSRSMFAQLFTAGLWPL
jgi:lantibiotic modifying enzyme